jgi:hypothetical protein
MNPVTSLADWRRRRAEQQAIAAQHPTVAGGPHADVLDFINRQLVPQGYKAGLWRASRTAPTRPELAHAAKPITLGYAATRCGLTLSGPHRAEPDVLLCRACFPS